MHRLYYNIKTFLILSAVLLIASSAQALPGEKYVVTEVHDGDTISIKLESFAGFPLRIERVRLIGMDAPEIKQKPWGWRAKRHLKKLISESDWVVNVEFDLQERDKYGRLLGYIWSRNSGILINQKMVEDGMAVLFTFPPNVRYEDRFIEEEQKAREKRVGIWGPDGLTQKPVDWRKEHPRDDSEAR
jgi:micrococcal nuclease